MTALVDTERLTARLDWELSPAELADAADTLEYLSDLARQHGRAWEDAAPAIVKSTILAAAVRYMRNSDGLTQSRAGDETMAWDGIGDKAGAPYFTDAEVATIRSAAGVGGITAVPTYAWGSSANRVRDVVGLVPTGADSKPFPLFASDESPW